MHSSLRRGLALMAVVLAMLAVLATTSPSVAAPVQPYAAGSATSTPKVITAGHRSELITTDIDLGTFIGTQTTGWIVVLNTSGADAQLTLRVFHENSTFGVELHPEKEVVTIPAHSRTAVPIVSLCEGYDGVTTFGVFGTPSADLTVMSASITVLAMTHAGNPITGYMENYQPAPVGGKPLLALSRVFQVKAPPAPVNGPFVMGWAVVDAPQMISGRQRASLDFLVDGKVVGTASGIVGPDRSLILPIGFNGDGFSAGKHVIAVRVRQSAGGLVFRSSFANAIGLPGSGAIPSATANGAGTALAVGTHAKQFLPASLTAASTGDAWMGGWIELRNTTGHAIAATVQATMGGDAEGPPVTVTVPANAYVSVPFGFLCDGEPAGNLDFGVTVLGSEVGLRYTGHGHLEAWDLLE
jgi:hypothetical protein